MDPTAAVPKEADGSVPALLSGFVPSAPGGADGSVPAAALESALAGRPAEEQEKTLTALVRAEAASTLGHAGAGEVGEDQAFSDLGFDSLAAVELRNRLNRVTGLRLPATALFDHPTPRALARRIRAEMAPDAAPGAAGILAELDRFEKLLAGLDPDQADLARVSTRLDVLVARLREATASAARGTADDTGSEHRHEGLPASGTLDDILARIDEEFGAA